MVKYMIRIGWRAMNQLCARRFGALVSMFWDGFHKDTLE